jgi:hypothetical protein
MSRCAALLALAFAAGCADGTGPDGGLVGTWTLTAVNNTALPTPAGGSVFGVPVWVHAGSLVLRADQTYTIARTLSVGSTGAKRENDATGTYTVNGNEVTLTQSTGVVDRGTIDGNSLTVREDQTSYHYVKRRGPRIGM